MKRKLVGGLLPPLLLVAAPAGAWTETYSWAAIPSATSYKVERSTDQGATWTSVGTPTLPSFAYTGTEPGLTLIRITACNAVGCTVRLADGLWHNEAWQPLAPPGMLTAP